MNGEQKQINWMFWIWWIVLTILSGFVGSYLSDTLGWGTQDFNGDAGTLFFMLDNGILALAVCAAQWILLRNHFYKSFWWFVAGTLGRFLGVLIGYMVVVTVIVQFNLSSGIWQFYLFSTLRGVVLGISQWIFLKQQRAKAGWWILASAVGWTIGLILIDTSQNELIRNGVDYAIAGIITGAAMIWILRQPIKEPKQETGSGDLVRAFILVWALSWGISWFIGWYTVSLIGWGFSFAIGGQVGGKIAGGIAGLIGGIGTAIVLKRAKPSDGLKIYQIALLALGIAGIVFYDWVGRFGIDVILAPGTEWKKQGIGGPMSGLVVGVLTAVILTWTNHSFNWKQFLLTIGGWAFGFSIGGLIAWNVGAQVGENFVDLSGSGTVSSLILLTLISGICGAFAGWIGGIATLRQFFAIPQNNNNESATSKE